MTTDEIVHTAMQFLIAGHETTTNLLGNIVLALGRDPSLLTRVREQPDTADRIVQETLRHDPSVQMVDRVAAEPLTLAGQSIAAGDRVMLSVAGANRDPKVFDAPGHFDVDREDVRKHLGFGSGIHVCLGAALTVLETRIAVQQLAAHTSEIDLPQTLVWRPSTTHRGLTALHVHMHPIRRA